MKTEEEVRELKAQWQADPLWVIEETEGFEECREDLLAFRLKCEENWAKAAAYRNERSTMYQVDRAVEMIQNANNRPGVFDAGTMIQMAIAHGLLALVAELRWLNDNMEGK